MSRQYEMEVEAAAEAIRGAERCEGYWLEVGGCEGLDGCLDCLELAAKAALRAVEEA